MAAKDESKELAVKEENVALAAYVDNFEEMAGMGGENVTQDDMAVPFIKIAQALSPEINKRESAYIPGLENGDFFNSSTKQIYKGEEGFKFIPILYDRQHLEWIPRDKGGGLAGQHGPEILDKAHDNGKGAYFLDNGNEIQITGTWFIVVINPDGTPEQAVITLAKTHFKRSKNLVTLLKGIQVPHSKGGKYNPPFFYNLIHATATPESNDQGAWYSWGFKREGRSQDVPDALSVLQFCKQTYDAVSGGALKVDFNKSQDTHNGPTVDGTRADRDPDLDKDIPF